MSHVEHKMGKVILNLSNELSYLRVGRANQAILDRIKVEYYGAMTPISQIAGVSIPDARTVLIQPWDVSILGEVEKAILKSDMGINPNNDGKCIRLNFPALTEERRRELTKTVRKYGEDAKIAIRNIRRDGLSTLKSQKSDGEVTEDEFRVSEDIIQKLADKHTKEVDNIVSNKEKEVLAI